MIVRILQTQPRERSWFWKDVQRLHAWSKKDFFKEDVSYVRVFKMVLISIVLVSVSFVVLIALSMLQ